MEDINNKAIKVKIENWKLSYIIPIKAWKPKIPGKVLN